LASGHYEVLYMVGKLRWVALIGLMFLAVPLRAQRHVKLKPGATYKIEALFRAQQKGARISLPKGKNVNLLLPNGGTHVEASPYKLSREEQGAALLRGGPLGRRVDALSSARGQVVPALGPNTRVKFRQDYSTGFGRETAAHTGDSVVIEQR
jgi:hypothetical protein